MAEEESGEAIYLCRGTGTCEPAPRPAPWCWSAETHPSPSPAPNNNNIPLLVVCPGVYILNSPPPPAGNDQTWGKNRRTKLKEKEGRKNGIPIFLCSLFYDIQLSSRMQGERNDKKYTRLYSSWRREEWGKYENTYDLKSPNVRGKKSKNITL